MRLFYGCDQMAATRVFQQWHKEVQVERGQRRETKVQAKPGNSCPEGTQLLQCSTPLFHLNQHVQTARMVVLELFFG